MPETDAPPKTKARIELLEQFLHACEAWTGRDHDNEEAARQALRFMNRNLLAVESTVTDSGVLSRAGTSDPFGYFRDGYPVIPRFVTSLIEQAIGFYEHIDQNTGLVHEYGEPQAFDIESALERALRKSFRQKQPSTEKEVQDAIEVILRAIGAPFTREQETVVVGARAFKPDFVLAPLDLALEVKLSNDKHTASKIQEEMAADITAYKTKWKRILFVIYDCNVIDDPLKMTEENLEHFGTHGISIRIIKH